jgi:hypothetical protein
MRKGVPFFFLVYQMLYLIDIRKDLASAKSKAEALVVLSGNRESSTRAVALSPEAQRKPGFLMRKVC